MARDWSQVGLNHWMVREAVDPERDISMAVLGCVLSEPQDGGSWRWRIEVSDDSGTREIVAQLAPTEAEAVRRAEAAMDEALHTPRQSAPTAAG